MTDASMPPGLDEHGRHVVDAALARIDAEASPNRLRILGTFLTVAGSIGFLATPIATQVTDIGREAATVLAFVALAMVIAGAGGILLSRRFIKAVPAKRAAEQIGRLASGGLSDDEVVDAAVRLLVNARGYRGTATTFDVRATADRLEAHLPRIRDVERELIARGLVLPVFTVAPVG